MKRFNLSQRRACHIFDQYVSTQRYEKKQSDFEQQVRQRTIELASKYGRYGYRRVTALLNREG